MRQRVVHGIGWKTASTTTVQLLRLVVAVLLARLLTPRDFGLAGMVLVFAALAPLLADLQFGAALIRRPHLTEADRSTVFWMSLGLGVLLTVVGVACAPLVAAFYGEPRVTGLFAALSLSFLFSSLSATHQALLTRDMAFRALEVRSIVASVIAATLAIALAATGFGPWAIIGQVLAASVISTALVLIVSRWQPRLMFSWRSLRELSSFTGNVFGARLLFFANRNVDNLLIGRFLGAAPLGNYAVSYNLMLLPATQVPAPVQEVLFPAFSRIQDDPSRIAAAWLRANRVVGAITIPVLLGLIVAAPDFIEVVLGDKWSDAVPVLQILAWVGLLQSLQGLNGSVLRAVDKTSWLVRHAVIAFVASLIAFVAGLPFGIVGVAGAYAIVTTIVEPYFTWLTCRSVGTTMMAFARSLAGVTQAAVAAVIVVALVRLGLIVIGAPEALRLASMIVAGVGLYLPLCAWRAPEVPADLRMIRGRPPSPAGVAPE